MEGIISRRGLTLPREGLKLGCIHKIMRRRGTSPKLKAAILEMLHGTTPTNDWLWGHGWQTEVMCSCSEVDNLAHALESCGGKVSTCS